MIDPNKIYTSMVSAGTKWADDNLTWQQLDDQVKPMLAAITIEAKNLEECSVAEATQIALSTNSYRDHLRDTALAKREALVSKVKYDACKSLFDAQRSVEATHRAAAGSAT
jgi:hypothetical protein